MIDFLSDLPYQTYTGLFLCSFFASYWLAPMITWLARGLRLPLRRQRTRQRVPPSLGGLVIGLPFIAGLSLLLLLKNQVSSNMYMVPLHTRGLFFGCCLALVTGLLHDILQLSRYSRLILQVTLASGAYYYGFHLDLDLDLIAGGINWADYMATLMWIACLINLFDFGTRSFRAFTGLILLLTLALLITAFLFDQYRTIVICCLLAGGLAGLRSHDASLRPNLGSSGAYFAGFVLSITVLQNPLAVNFYGFLLYIVAANCVILLLALFRPWRMLQSSLRPNRNKLQIKILRHLKEAAALQIESAASTTACLSRLERATIEFAYCDFAHLTSTHPSPVAVGPLGEGREKVEFALGRSGGAIVLTRAVADRDPLHAEKNDLFAELVDHYDLKIEECNLDAIEQRKNSLRVLLVNRYYAGTSGTGQILADLAADLHDAGAAVTVLTGGSSYEAQTTLPGRNELVNGIHIARVPATHFGRTSALNRVMDFAFFYLFAIAWICKTPTARYTHVVTLTDPPLIAVTGYIATKLKGWFFAYNVQDLYPETALALGMLKQGLFYRLCRHTNIALLKKADAVIAISHKMAAYIDLLAKPKRQEVIANWADGKTIAPVAEPRHDIALRLGLKDIYTVTYAGNIGLTQEIDTLIDLISTFRGRKDLQFLFIGGGVHRGDLERAAVECGLDNVHFVPYLKRSELVTHLGVSDLGIVTLAPAMERLAFPSRTYTYLAAGLPVLTIGHADSELSHFARAGLGAHLPSVAADIAAFIEGEMERDRSSDRQRIRAHFEAHCDRPGQTGKYLALLRDL